MPIGKRPYLTTAQIKELSDSGHVIGCHTGDHQDVRKLKRKDWDLQVNKSKRILEQIIGKLVLYFAYPFGAWKEAAVNKLKKLGIKAAFQLSGKQSEKKPLYTISRPMVPGNWRATTLYKRINTTFH